MMKNHQHNGNADQFFFFFCVSIEMIPKFQRGTRSYSNTSFLQCAANGLALCSRKGRTMIKVMGVGEGGGAKYKKIYHARENLSEKNSCMQSRPEKKKTAFHTFCTTYLKKVCKKAYCVQNISSLNKLSLNSGLVLK